MGEETSYSLAAPKGEKVAQSSLKTEQLAQEGFWLLVLGSWLNPNLLDVTPISI
jgi:hypothetical protein